MDNTELNKIIWPTSVDMMGQIVVAMTFFFLLMFVILAYFLKQIELRKRVRTNEITYQILYEQIGRYIAPKEIKRAEVRRPNIDELILQIQDYLLSVPEVKAERIKSLIAKRNELVGELHNLGYTGYSANNPFTGDYASMPIISTDLLDPQGKWQWVQGQNLSVVRFSDNSMAPDRDSARIIREGLANFAGAADGRTISLRVYDSNRLKLQTLNQRLSLRRAVSVRDSLRAGGVQPEAVRIQNMSASSRYPFGAVEIRYE